MDERALEVSLLIVDDSKTSLAWMTEVLAPLGHRLITAASGEAALEHVGREQLAAVLMDVHLPGIDGFETTRRLRALPNGQTVPVIFVSSDNLVQQSFALGAVDFVHKPFDPDLLRAKVGALVALCVRGCLERSRLESELAKERERMNELFIAILGHDLRNPLSTIGLATRVLSDDETLAPAHRKAVARIASASGRMARLIDAVCDFTRGRLGGGIPITRAETSLVDICFSAIDEAQPRARGRLSFEHNGDCRGEWDRERVAQAVANLLGNALEHSDGPVSVRLDDRGDHVAMSVHNRGPKIPEADRARLFEPFFRGGHKGGGLGLGLYIVKEIARAHGAEIRVDSSDEAGTVFTVIWPRQQQISIDQGLLSM